MPGREIVASEEEGVLGGNKVVSEDDNVESAWLSAEVDISNENVEEPPMKRRRRFVTPSALEDVDRRNGLIPRRHEHL